MSREARPKKGEERREIRGHVPQAHVPGESRSGVGVTPTVHLICNAHLDPVWQWRWEEGASEALATFRNAADILDENPGLVFCHNEAVLYQWVERYDKGLFRDIARLVRARRWVIAGGWFLQPDVNLPGTESLIRQIAEGRRYFRETFGAEPRVAYNFDSFGHSGGLPQILRGAGYEMYIHMRPQSRELSLPADLYRWRGLDGTEIPACRISVGLYHTERDNIAERLKAGTALALELGRDVPVFWGLGNHGGGATRRDLRTIKDFIAAEDRVKIVHSSPDAFYEAVKHAAEEAPVFEGDLGRCFTGCYTSLSRLKRRAVVSLGGLVQSETAAAAAWWLRGDAFDGRRFREAWRGHLFNDFHDIITGTCVEPAEKDALDLYGKAEDEARDLKLGAVAALNRGRLKSPDLPVTVVNSNPSLTRVPVEFECMADYRPFWKGEWRLRLFRADGEEIACQEEQPDALLPFNNWRRRICFMDDLPGVGVRRYHLEAFEVRPQGRKQSRGRGADIEGEDSCSRQASPGLRAARPLRSDSVVSSRAEGIAHGIDPLSGFVTSLKTAWGGECLAGPLFEPLVIEDACDSWGTECWSYGTIAGAFKPEGPPVVLVAGPIRSVTQSVFVHGRSRIVQDVYSYLGWPVLDVRLRITWNEERRRLKLRIPTRFDGAGVFCEVPGGAISRPADGQEHVHGRWLLIQGKAGARPATVAVVNSGQHGLDCRDGEVRLSVLRSSAYCHERGFAIGKRPVRRFADIGEHDVRLLVTAGEPDAVKAILPGLADYLSAPPVAYAHLPDRCGSNGTSLLRLQAEGVRLLACKPSWDRKALIIRLQEAVGAATKAELRLAAKGAAHGIEVSLPKKPEGAKAGETSGAAGRNTNKPDEIRISLRFAPFEIKTVRVEPGGRWSEVALIDEH